MSWSLRHYIASYVRSSLWIVLVAALVLQLITDRDSCRRLGNVSSTKAPKDREMLYDFRPMDSAVLVKSL